MPTNSPLFFFITNLILCNLEKRMSETLGITLSFYLRYIDDIVYTAVSLLIWL